jgi:Helix-turn-helix domain of resolvase
MAEVSTMIRQRPSGIAPLRSTEYIHRHPTPPLANVSSISWACSQSSRRTFAARQLEGIAKAKAAGVYKGRPSLLEASRVRELKAQGVRPVDIAKALKISRASVYRVLGQNAAR